MNIKVEPDGSMVLSNDRTEVKVAVDGTVSLSSIDPIVLTDAALYKVDRGDIDVKKFLERLAVRLEKKQ